MKLSAIFTAALLAGPALSQNLINGSFEEHSLYTGNDGVNWGITGFWPGHEFAWSNLPVGTPVLTGWTVFGGDADLVTEAVWYPSDGMYSVDLNGWRAGGLAQKLTFVEPTTGFLQFDLSNNPWSTTNGQMEVFRSFGGGPEELLGRFQFGDSFQWSMGWRTDGTGSVLWDAGEWIVMFVSTTEGNAGPALDNVSFEMGASPYPEWTEPSSLPPDFDVPLIPEPQSLGLIAGLGLVGFGLWRRIR